MRVLLVEDKIDFAKSVERELAKIPDCETVWVKSRDSAFAKLNEHGFDLVILDRRIPATDEGLDDAQEHGWAVFQDVRTRMPGTSVFFLTGTEDADFPTQLLNEYSRVEDVHGTGTPEQMYQVFWKKRVTECVKRVRAFAIERAELDRIAVQPEAGGRALLANEIQVLRLFSRRNNGAMAQVKELSGGLSDSRVLKVVVKRADGQFVMSAVAKVSTLAMIDDEGNRYRADILRLTAGGYPSLAATVSVGAANRGGLFYATVGDTVESLFDRIVVSNANVPGIPAAVRAIEGPWYQGSSTGNVTVSRIRRKILADTELPAIQAQLDGIDIQSMEGCEVAAARCCQHGDLHCANIVFDQRGDAMLIDFGDAGPSFASVDPVTLELSTLFHLQASRLPSNWPTGALLGQWSDVDAYVVGCSFPEFIRACRQWALGVAGSPEEVAAVAYSYALRQLKYDDTNKPFARALIRHCIATVTGQA
ncbi:MAG: response regulator [Xanthobacteraceae bacterium]